MDTYTSLIKQQKRLAGVLLHPTALPSGKLDDDAFLWLDFITNAGLNVWQVLPLGVPQSNHSPYQCYSAFAMNPALLDDSDYRKPDLENINYQQWYQQEQYWLADYALFMSLKSVFEQSAWTDWDTLYRQRDPNALAQFSIKYRSSIDIIYWQQYCLYQRWHALRDYAHQRDILLFGDIPIFVAHDSADVWANPELFLLDEHGQAQVVAGVPPDYFSETGQRWGNPHYNWERMAHDDFNWWMNRLENHFMLFDLVRIDHFRGLESAWVIPAHCQTAMEGQWQKALGDQLLSHLKEVKGDVAIIAEDLGIITPEVTALREKYQLAGMSVLQFSFDAFEDNPHKPHNIGYDRIVYTGTHDNDTSQGWFDDQASDRQAYILKTLGIDNTAQVVDALIESAFNSQAQLAIIPLQDFLGFSSEARMNLPGVSEGNWQWQFQWQVLHPELVTKIHKALTQSGRLI